MTSQNVDPSVSRASKEMSSSSSIAMDGHAVTKRLQQDLMTLMMSGDQGVSAFPDGDNLFSWVATINGGADTMYDSLSYKLALQFPSRYPYVPPTVKFSTPCFHPNVDEYGNICLDILKEKWSALYDVRTILLSIQSLLAEPNNESPLNVEAAQLWNNKTEYKAKLLHKYREATKNGI